MSAKENARPTVGAAGQAERESHWASGNSRNDFTTWNGPISRLLMHGQENGLHLSDLTKKLTAHKTKKQTMKSLNLKI